MSSAATETIEPDTRLPPSVSAEPTAGGGRLVGSRAQVGRALQEGKPDKPVIVFPLRVWVSLVFLLVLFVGIGALYFWVVTTEAHNAWISPLMTLLWLVAGGGVLTVLHWMRNEFILFGDELSQWAARLRTGDLSARMPTTRANCPSLHIRDQLNAITDDYQAVSRLQRQRLSQQERFLAQKNSHLSVLYDVATCVNRSTTLEGLLNRFMSTLQSVFEAEAVAVRLLDAKGDMRLVASVGLADEVLGREITLPRPDCLCGRAATEQVILRQESMEPCGEIIGCPLFEQSADINMLAIPLQYREKTLGVYNLFVSRERFVRLEDEQELLTSIGQHLGMAIEKASVDEEAITLSIMQERTRMAHELHDSLAQTLASLRFKVRLFDDTLNRGDSATVWQEMEGLQHTIDEAYAELRSLITHFRAPIDGKGVVRAVEKLSERFRAETGLEVFFYHNWSLKDLDRDIEVEVIRIVQEALVNVRKHSQASTVRILMYSSEEGRCSILVEDDGTGLPDPLPEPNPITGEHIGMHVMQERADKIAGEIQFESDPDEGGTLMQLSFEAPPTRKLSELVGRQDMSG